MKAVILETAKSLERVNGKPLIQYAFDAAIDSGVSELVVATNPYSDSVAANYEDSYREHPIKYTYDEAETSLGDRFRSVSRYIENGFLVFKGNVEFDFIPDLPVASPTVWLKNTPELPTFKLRGDTISRMTMAPSEGPTPVGTYYFPPEVFDDPHFIDLNDAADSLRWNDHTVKGEIVDAECKSHDLVPEKSTQE